MLKLSAVGCLQLVWDILGLRAMLGTFSVNCNENTLKICINCTSI